MSDLPEIALKDMMKYPRQAVLYLCLVGLGWLGNRLIPDDKDKEIDRLVKQIENLNREKTTMTYEYINSLKEKNQQLRQKDSTQKATDSTVNVIYHKIIKHKR